MSDNVFVVDTLELGGTYSCLGYDNILPDAAVTGNEDIDYPLTNAFDHSDATEFSPDTTATEVFEFTAAQKVRLNYFGLVSKNGADSGLSVKVEIYDFDIADYTEVANFTVSKNGEPVAVYFGEDQAAGFYETNAIRVSFTSTTKAYIFAMHAGEALVFPRTPSLGWQPGATAPLDKVEQSVTEGNNFIQGRRRERGYQTKITINFVAMDEIRDWMPELQEYMLDCKGLFFFSNSINQLDVIYGRQNPATIPKPAYSTSNHAHLNFEILGYA